MLSQVMEFQKYSIVEWYPLKQLIISLPVKRLTYFEKTAPNKQTNNPPTHINYIIIVHKPSIKVNRWVFSHDYYTYLSILTEYISRHVLLKSSVASICDTIWEDPSTTLDLVCTLPHLFSLICEFYLRGVARVFKHPNTQQITNEDRLLHFL